MKTILYVLLIFGAVNVNAPVYLDDFDVIVTVRRKLTSVVGNSKWRINYSCVSGGRLIKFNAFNKKDSTKILGFYEINLKDSCLYKYIGIYPGYRKITTMTVFTSSRVGHWYFYKGDSLVKEEKYYKSVKKSH